jgi:hypothetical protein
MNASWIIPFIILGGALVRERDRFQNWRSLVTDSYCKV